MKELKKKKRETKKRERKGARGIVRDGRKVGRREEGR